MFFPPPFLVIIVILCPCEAKAEERWKTVDPMPPQRGGYSADNMAMCIQYHACVEFTCFQEIGYRTDNSLIQIMYYRRRYENMSDTLPVHVTVVIPTRNEEAAIVDTIRSIPKGNWCEKIDFLIVDGNSTDRTRELAEKEGANVYLESRKGYGRAYKTGFSMVLITSLDLDAIAIILSSFAIPSKLLVSTAEANSALAYGLASGVSSIIAYKSSAAFFKIASCFSGDISSPRIF